MVVKTSRFRPEEADGILEALAEANVPYSDLVWVWERSPITIYREGAYIRPCVAQWFHSAAIVSCSPAVAFRTTAHTQDSGYLGH